MRKFDTCFFERYAQITLETVLGEEFADLINQDRPDLQKPDKSLGIEVTRAMEPKKEAAMTMLKEMAGFEVQNDTSESDREEMAQIASSGYGYGLQDGRYVGHLEYEYYGDFKEFGLYIFCKDDLTEDDAIMTMEYASELQRHLDVKYSKMYLSTIDRLYVCDLAATNRVDHKTTCTSHDISRKMCKIFFIKALENA